MNASACSAIRQSYARLAPPDELQVEDTVDHDDVPLDGADVFQWREIESIGGNRLSFRLL
jgi:hypothetical protein